MMNPFAPHEDETDESPTVQGHILAAVVDVATTFGISRLSVGDVARRAGLSLPTLYRHFPSKDELVAHAVVHETAVLIEQVVAATRLHADPQQAIQAGLETALAATRAHPLLDRLLRTEPEALLPLVTQQHGPVMTHVRQAVTTIFAERFPTADPARLALAADTATRLLISYAISAPAQSPAHVSRFLASALTEALRAALA